MSTIYIGGVRYDFEEYYRMALWREERRRERDRQHAIQAWQQARQSLMGDIEKIQNVTEREQLAVSVQGLEASFIQSMMSGNPSSAERLVADMRQKVISVQMDERMLASQREDLSRFLSKLEKDAPAGFTAELEAIRTGSIGTEQMSIEEQTRRVKELYGEARRLAEEAAQANAISLDGMVEEAVFIPPAVSASETKAEDASLKTALVRDICDFGGRVAFFDEDEADRLKPLVLEAKQSSDTPRLRLIRDQVKTTYGRLKERAVLTELFKRDMRDFLPPMRKAAGEDAKKLCVRIEDLLTAPIITRQEYNGVYEAVREIFEAQEDRIRDAFFAQKVEEALTNMGYALLDEEGNPAGLLPEKARLLTTPYEGYSVRVKAGKDGTFVTRLVRTADSEEEKASVSEYQRQKDIETGKKWCHDLDRIHEALRSEGLTLTTALRKEPGTEPLDIIVGKSERKQKKEAARQQQGQLRERQL